MKSPPSLNPAPLLILHGPSFGRCFPVSAAEPLLRHSALSTLYSEGRIHLQSFTKREPQTNPEPWRFNVKSLTESLMLIYS